MATLYEEVRATLRESEFRPRKRLGQNFLVHENIIESILRLLDLSSEDEIVEIGPGLGFLTRRLLDKAKRVSAVEIDSALIHRLQRSSLGSHEAFRLIHNDILTADGEFDIFQNMTVGDVQRVAKTYFTQENRTVLTILPSGRSGQ